MAVTVYAGKVTRVTMDGVFTDFGGLLEFSGLDGKPGDDIVCSVQLVTPPKPPSVERRSGDIEKGRPSRPGPA